MKALVLEGVKDKLVYKEVEEPQLGDNEVLVAVQAAALNHRDVYITQGLYPGIKVPIILGSDGAGIVAKVGAKVDQQWLNKAIVINPNNGWGANEAVQHKRYHILGMPTNGAFAEYVKVDVSRLVEKPNHLNFEESAALPLAGLTAHRSVFTKGNLQVGERVLISGIGGGVALVAFQLALAAGAEVYVTSGSDEKIAKAIDMGAKGGANYKSDNWYKELAEKAGGFNLIIDSAGGDGFRRFLDLALPAGRIVFYGGTRGKFMVNPQKMFWKQLSIHGSTMGSDQDFQDMIDFVGKHQIKPVVDSVWAMKDGQEAFDHMDQGKQFGKIVLKN